MNGNYLLDTNIIIALFAGETQVHGRLKECAAVFISAISVGELVYGAHKSQRVTENLSRIRYFVANNTVWTRSNAPALECLLSRSSGKYYRIILNQSGFIIR